MSYITKLTDYEVDAMREVLSKDFRLFSNFCFKILTGNKLIHVDYYDVLFNTIQTAIDGKNNRIILTIPPLSKAWG